MAVLTVTTSRDGVDAADGRLSLREAVAATARDPGADTIQFARFLEGGTLTLTGGELTLRGQVTVDGDGDDDGAGVSLSGGRADRVLSIAGPGTAVRLEDVEVAQGAVTNENGGGILAGAGTALTLDGCTVRDSIVRVGETGKAAGGAIFAGDGSQVTILDSELRGNFAYGAGGAVATGAGARLAVTGCSLRDNNAYTVGGAIAVTGGSRLVMERTDASGNSAGNFYAGSGGAVSIRGAAATIRESSLVENSGRQSGGALDVRSSGVLIESTTIAGNTVRGRNGAGEGGGIASTDGSELRLVNSTVTGNFASYYNSDIRVPVGGGIYARGILELANTIVAGNSSGGSPRIGADRVADDIEGRITRSNGHNLFGTQVDGDVSGDRAGIGPARIFAGVDPATGGGVLALAGGPTRTAGLRNDPANPALGGADPLDAGVRDQLGTLRSRPSDGMPDIGALELAQGRPSLQPGDGNDLLVGTAGADTRAGRLGNDLLRGLDGNDTLSGDEGGDALEGGAGADLLRGGGGFDNLFGGAGADRLFGEAGDDRLAGGADADRLAGGDGNDLLTGGAGNDVLAGEAGVRDQASWLRDEGPAGLGVTVDLAGGVARRGQEVDTLTGIEDLRGTDQADGLTGNGLANLLFGVGGNDRLVGGAGDDVLDGGFGADTLDGGAGAGDLAAFGAGGPAVAVDLAAGRAVQGGVADRLIGIEGAVGTGFDDRLNGNAGSNILRGGDGADVLYGGLGRDTLAGGTGTDRFVYDAVAESPTLASGDVVKDFTWASDGFVDRLDLSGIDARAATANVNDAFAFIETEAFSGAGQVRWRSLADGTVVEANTGGSLAPDLTIELAGTFVVDADSFVL